jgi:hypothetical protein
MVAAMSITNATPRREQISVRLDPRQIARLEREAQSERRPISSLVRNLLDDALRDRERRNMRPSNG